MSYGRNLLIYNVAKEYVERFVKYDAKQEPVKIVALEKKFENTLKINNKTINFKGFFDRIDSSNNNIRIIDYKTGTVSPKELKINECYQLLEEDKPKAFQVLLYAWLYKKNYPEAQNIVPGIISLRNISNGFMQIKFLDKNQNINNTLPDFENTLKTLIENIFDTAIPFTQTGNTDSCKYCEFKNICNR